MICSTCKTRTGTKFLTDRQKGSMRSLVVCDGCFARLPSLPRGGVVGFTVDAFDPEALTAAYDRAQNQFIRAVLAGRDPRVARVTTPCRSITP